MTRLVNLLCLEGCSNGDSRSSSIVCSICSGNSEIGVIFIENVRSSLKIPLPKYTIYNLIISITVSILENFIGCKRIVDINISNVSLPLSGRNSSRITRGAFSDLIYNRNIYATVVSFCFIKSNRILCSNFGKIGKSNVNISPSTGSDYNNIIGRCSVAAGDSINIGIISCATLPFHL